MSDYKLRTKSSWAQTMGELEQSLDKWGASEIDVNYPKGARSEKWFQDIEDRRVILRYKKNGAESVLTMDKQSRAVDNLRVLYICIESIRMNERRGFGELMQQAYVQLAAPVHKKDPYEVLGVFQDSSLEVCESVYRTLATRYHPDNAETGSNGLFIELNEAIEEIRRKHGKV